MFIGRGGGDERRDEVEEVEEEEGGEEQEEEEEEEKKKRRRRRKIRKALGERGIESGDIIYPRNPIYDSSYCLLLDITT